MISKNHQATAAQKRFHAALADMGCANCGQGHDTCLHHAVGAAGRHNKLWIGQWWVIPLCWDCHQGPQGRHGDRRALHCLDPVASLWTGWELDKHLFGLVAADAEAASGEKVPDTVRKAIKEYRP